MPQIRYSRMTFFSAHGHDVGPQLDPQRRRTAVAGGGLAGGERRPERVPDLVGLLHVIVLGAEEPRVLVVAGVPDVAADVTPSIEVLLV